MPLKREPKVEATQAEPESAFWDLIRRVTESAWTLGLWVFWAGIFGLDVAIVIGMQLFLESIGRKRGGGSVIVPKKNVADILAKANGASPGTPIPTPSATPPPGSTQRLSVLSQEEFLAACLTEHWLKLVLGTTLAVVCRLPQLLLGQDSFAYHMLVNLSVMLRCMSLVLLLIREDMTLPKKSREKAHNGASAAEQTG